MYVKYKPDQLVNRSGIHLNIIYINKANETIELILDDDYCSIAVLDNDGWSVEPWNRRMPKGFEKLLNRGLVRGDGRIIDAGKSNIIKINIDKIVVRPKEKSPNKKKEELADMTPSKYGIQLTCMAGIITISRTKIERIYLPVETDVFMLHIESQNR